MAKKSKQERMGGPGMLGGLGMMKQLQQMQQQMIETKEALAEETVTATAGGGVISVTANGNQIIESISIDPDLLQDSDVEMLQDLILTAVNAAIEKSKEMVKERLGPLTGGFPF
jgi:DNA-binding YbaB/EbfC family protein